MVGYGVVGYGREWWGMVWCGKVVMVCGMVWNGKVWYGVKLTFWLSVSSSSEHLRSAA